MKVSEAILRRRSTRAFSPQPVSGKLVRHLLQAAGQAPSGGNLQPWHVHALTGEVLKGLLTQVTEQGPSRLAGYDIYPKQLKEPYRTRRYQGGEDLYATLGIAQDDKAGRMQQLFRNATFFGAPVGLFILIDRQMGPPQCADLGIYLQSLMLLAVEVGLDSCPQEFWAMYSDTVEGFLAAPKEQMLFCGIALGYRDETAAVNQLETGRAPFSDWGQMHGFDAD